MEKRNALQILLKAEHHTYASENIHTKICAPATLRTCSSSVSEVTAPSLCCPFC